MASVYDVDIVVQTNDQTAPSSSSGSGTNVIAIGVSIAVGLFTIGIALVIVHKYGRRRSAALSNRVNLGNPLNTVPVYVPWTAQQVKPWALRETLPRDDFKPVPIRRTHSAV
jgi:hypothetical protein